MRLGNIHLVSAKRGWWTSTIKSEIWARGGANFLVGKFNVGKSALFEVTFPKGSGERAPVYADLVEQQTSAIAEQLDVDKLLPPLQPEVPFPTLPLVSSLPGTTASPIRLSYGNKKGELIDMPGLERGNLDRYVRPEHKLDLVMTSRASAQQLTIKPGQSLLLGGGVVRLTPVLDVDESLVVLACPFVPLEAHVTSTEKAIGTQQQERESGIKTILAEGVGAQFKSAGVFPLSFDVTKHYAGAVLRGGASISSLPFRVYSADLLIQGVGWIELVCQVRKRRLDKPSQPIEPPQTSPGDEPPTGDMQTLSPLFTPFTPQIDAGFNLPEVEVFTPNGEHIGSRRPMGAWTLWKVGKLQRNAKLPARPRRSMKGDKAQKKREARAQAGAV
jgi:genetic interactor of prohibitins 3, mitochondrial